LLRYRCAILKKANAKANNFCGLGRTMPESSVGGIVRMKRTNRWTAAESFERPIRKKNLDGRARHGNGHRR
jgi:hypothetical protein